MTDTEDEDLERAIALSLQQPQPTANDHSKRTSADGSIQPQIEADISTAEPKHSQAQPTDLLQLDRKAMEQERLARVAARSRQRPISPPLLRHESERPSKIRKLDVPKPNMSSNKSSDPATNPVARSRTQVQYPNGIVKRTWARGHPRDNDIKIEEVLQPSSLRIAVLSAFQWDTEWLLSKIGSFRTRFVLVLQAKEEAQRQQYIRETRDWPHVRLCFPPMPGQVSCMHSKLMLLFHEDYIRVVVPSANLVAYDWGETGVMENSVFLIDLPRLPEDQRMKQKLTPFGEELLYFLDAMGMDDDVKEGMLKFDFAKTGNLGFVHTIGGAHLGEHSKRTGYLSLSHTVRTLGIQTEDPVEIDFTTSSVGSLNEAFLKTIHNAAKGQEDGNSKAAANGKRPKSNFFAKTSEAKNKSSPNAEECFKIYFPTEDTVLKSTGGPQNGGTICFQSKWYDAPAFPKYRLRDYQSTRKGLLSHNKIMYVRGKRQKDDGSRVPMAWAYVGSANLSESAWGKVVTDKATKQPKLNARNWECGVVMQVPLDGNDGTGEDLSMNVFKDTIGLPFTWPAEEYGARRPWFFMG